MYAPKPAPSAAATRLLKRLHFYAGIVVAPFLLLAAITGGLYAIAPAAEQLVYRAQLHTDSVGQPQSLHKQLAAAQATVPALRATGIRPSDSPGTTTRVLFDDDALPASTSRAVFVDPVTLAVQGELPSYGSSGSLPLRTWISGLHRDLHLGEPGRLYSEFAASWLWVIALAGVALWAINVRKRRRTRGTWRLPTRTMNAHAWVGVVIAVGLVFLSATGLTWSTYAGENVTALRAALNWTQPEVDSALGSGEHAGHGGMSHPQGSAAPESFHPDAALALAQQAGVGRDQAVEISLPADSGTAYTVTEIRAPGQFSPNTAVVDPNAQRVLAVDWFADWPLAARLANLGIGLHMGILLGLANQLVLLATMIALILVIVHGYRLWWQRRPRGARRPGRAPTRGALRALPWPLIGAVAAIAIVTGWFIPLLGWPLLAFLVVDVALSLRQRPARANASST